MRRILASLTLLPAVLAADIEVEMLYQRVLAVTMTTTKSAPPTECTYTPPPRNCERACGVGNVPCVNETRCYNPYIGEVCCLDGSMSLCSEFDLIFPSLLTFFYTHCHLYLLFYDIQALDNLTWA